MRGMKTDNKSIPTLKSQLPLSSIQRFERKSSEICSKTILSRSNPVLIQDDFTSNNQTNEEGILQYKHERKKKSDLEFSKLNTWDNTTPTK